MNPVDPENQLDIPLKKFPFDNPNKSGNNPNKHPTLRFQYLSDITKDERIGGGNFGDVFKGKMSEAPVALKSIKKMGALDEFHKEAEIMSQLNHPNVIRFYGIWKELETNEEYIVTDFMNRGDLWKLLQKHSEKMTIPVLLNFCKEICKGMVYLESQKMIHRDLACRNILVRSADSSDLSLNVNSLELRVADFGLSRSQIYFEKTDTKVKLPYRWTAPEALSKTLFSTKSDVWSFGVVMWEIFALGKIPFPHLDYLELIETLEKKGCTLEKPKNCPDQVFEIMQMTWEMKPENRPTFKELFEKLKSIEINQTKPENEKITSESENGTDKIGHQYSRTNGNENEIKSKYVETNKK